MAELNDAELKWRKRVQRALDACPSPDIGFYTIGDLDVVLYRVPEGDFSDAHKDHCIMVDDADAGLGELKFPRSVHSTAG
jgi:hypothetical protein